MGRWIGFSGSIKLVDGNARNKAVESFLAQSLILSSSLQARLSQGLPFRLDPLPDRSTQAEHVLTPLPRRGETIANEQPDGSYHKPQDQKSYQAANEITEPGH